jgi:hypothetical protein
MLNDSNTEIKLILHLQKICENRLFMLKNIISDNDVVECIESNNHVNYCKILNTYYSTINIHNINKEIDDVNTILTDITKTLASTCHHNFVYDDIDITPCYSKVIHYCTICEIDYDVYKKQL